MNIFANIRQNNYKHDRAAGGGNAFAVTPIGRKQQEGTMNTKLTSGKIAPKTGEYKIIASNGRSVGTVRVKKGDRMPPTQHSGSHFEIN